MILTNFELQIFAHLGKSGQNAVQFNESAKPNVFISSYEQKQF